MQQNLNQLWMFLLSCIQMCIIFLKSYSTWRCKNRTVLFVNRSLFHLKFDVWSFEILLIVKQALLFYLNMFLLKWKFSCSEVKLQGWTAWPSKLVFFSRKDKTRGICSARLSFQVFCPQLWTVHNVNIVREDLLGK